MSIPNPNTLPISPLKAILTTPTSFSACPTPRTNKLIVYPTLTGKASAASIRQIPNFIATHLAADRSLVPLPPRAKRKPGKIKFARYQKQNSLYHRVSIHNTTSTILFNPIFNINQSTFMQPGGKKSLLKFRLKHTIPEVTFHFFFVKLQSDPPRSTLSPRSLCNIRPYPLLLKPSDYPYPL